MRHPRFLAPLALILTLAACGGAAAPSASPASPPPSAAASVKPAASAPASAKPAASAAASAKPAAAASVSAAAKPSTGPATGPSGAGAGGYSGGDPNGTLIKIGYASPAVASWPFYAALTQGLFTQQHLNVSMIQMPANVAITALSKGEIDFINSPSNAMEGATRGLPMKMVLSSWASTPWTISGKQDFKSIKDLKGKILGTNQAGSSPYLYMQAALKRAGMTVADVQAVSSPGTQDTYALLIGGKLDAAVLSPPFDADAEGKGFHEVEFIGDALDQPYIGLGTTTAYIASHRPTVVATIKALMDGNAWLKAHPSEAADLIVKYIGVDAATAQRSATKMLPLLGETGELSPAGVQQAIDIQSEVTKTTLAVTPTDLVDWGPLHEALGKA